jgi:hypothetical protein
MTPGPTITYFSDEWPRRDEDEPRPWQNLPLGVPHTITLPHKRSTVDHIAMELFLVRRGQWGSRTPNHNRMEGDWDYTDIVIHHSGNSGEKEPSKIENKHMNEKKWDDVGYHYLIKPDGAIFEGRHLAFKGSHVELQNTRKIGILIMGDFESNWWDVDDDVSPEQEKSVQKLISALTRRMPSLVTLGGHRDYKKTECPGDKPYGMLEKLRKQSGLQPPAKK